jgi:hypothetical protein
MRRRPTAASRMFDMEGSDTLGKVASVPGTRTFRGFGYHYRGLFEEFGVAVPLHRPKLPG